MQQNNNISVLNLYLIFSFLLLVAGVIVFDFLNIITLSDGSDMKSSQYLYFVSTIAQSLAAILALTITITIVVTQLQSQYSHHTLRDFLDIYTLIYIVWFIITITLSFLLLSTEHIDIFAVVDRVILTKILLVMSLGCLLFLIPFLLSFRDKLNIQSIIKRLEREAELDLEKNPAKEPYSIKSLESLAFRANELKDAESFEIALKALTDLLVNAADHAKNSKPNVNSDRVQSSIMDRIEYLFEITMNDKRHSRIISNSIGRSLSIAVYLKLPMHSIATYFKLPKFCFKAMSMNNEPLAISYCRELRTIAIAGVRMDDLGLTNTISSYITVIGYSALDKEMNDLFREVIGLHIGIGTQLVNDDRDEKSRKIICSNLNRLEEKYNAGNDYRKISIFGLDTVTEYMLTIHESTKKSFEAFKKYYENDKYKD